MHSHERINPKAKNSLFFIQNIFFLRFIVVSHLELAVDDYLENLISTWIFTIYNKRTVFSILFMLA